MNRSLRYAGLLALLQLSLGSLHAQHPYADSLIRVAATADELHKGRLYLRAGSELIREDTALCLSCLEKGYSSAQKAQDDFGKGMYRIFLGNFLATRARFDDAVESYASGDSLLSSFLKGKPGKDDQQQAVGMLLETRFSRASILLEQYEYDKAVSIFHEILDLIGKTDFPDKLIARYSTLQSIALAYYHQSQWGLALDYYRQSLPSAAAMNNPDLTARAQIYVAACQSLLKHYDSAEWYLAHAAEAAQHSPDQGLRTDFYARSAELQRFTGKYNAALPLYDSAIQYTEKIGDIYRKGSFTVAKAECLMELKRYPEARITAKAGLDIALSIHKKREILNAQSVLSEIEAATGNYQLAYEYLHAYQLGNDSLNTEALKKETQRLEKQYQARLQESRIRELEKDKLNQRLQLNRKNTLNQIMAVGSFLLLLIILLIYRMYRSRQKLQQQRIHELETEKQLAATEAVLRGEAQERSRLARDLHDSLGGMLSGIKYSFQNMKENLIMTPDNMQVFERGIDMLDGSIHELRRVAHNMMPEILVKYGLDTAMKEFCAEIRRSGVMDVQYVSMGLEQLNTDQNAALAVYRVVQELVSNAIKHSGGKQVIVQAQTGDEGKRLFITVEDDGKGFDPAILQEEKGIGWKNIQSRIRLLQGRSDLHTEPGKGTSVLIEIPLT